MQAEQLLDYLHEHQTTRTLAEELAEVLVLRRRRDLAATTAPASDSRRIAS